MTVFRKTRRLKIRKSIRNKVYGTAERPRLSVFRSNKAIYTQIIDDREGVTLAALSSRDLSITNNIESCKKVGIKIAEESISKGIKKVVFDRSGYLYHGRVKSLAEGAREGGLEF